MSADYSFPGVQPFIERSAAEAGVPALAITPLRGLWHVARVQDALAQVAKADPATQQALLDQAEAHRDALVAALDGVDAAIAHVSEGLGLSAAGPKPSAPPDDARELLALIRLDLGRLVKFGRPVPESDGLVIPMTIDEGLVVRAFAEASEVEVDRIAELLNLQAAEIREAVAALKEDDHEPEPEPAEPEPSDESPADEEADLEPEAHDAHGDD